MTTFIEARAEAKAREVAAETDAKIAARDATVERKIRAREAEAELARKRAETALAEREAKAAAKDAEAARKAQRRAQRREARAARRSEALASVIGYARGNAPAVYSAGIYGMALYVAVSGQISVATERGWPVLIGIGMAAFLEGTALSMALTAHQQRLKGERALTPRVMTWVAAGFAAAINFGAHADDLVMAAVLGASSLAAIVVWEVRSGAKHRDALRRLGLIPDPPERFGWRRWVRYPRSTFAAWSLDVRSRAGTGAAELLARVDADRTERQAAKAAERREAEATRTAERDAKTAERAARRDAAKLARSERKATKGADRTAKDVATDRPDAGVSAKPRRRARTATAKSKRAMADDAALVAKLRAIAEETGTAVSINRARTELGVGTSRAKRLLTLAAASATDPAAEASN
ncbi:DUF2637 domain-containing protein [Glycomyces tenuis]|uniref:DUF2637 domain-containing protein n=1 Tax=Glycomyces tenuis TaxID=58116 RepID=UPI00041E78B7|nr:DUF2637 domain-containing protein [Glycomyces tenuis]